jgi:hypothetical protein
MLDKYNNIELELNNEINKNIKYQDDLNKLILENEKLRNKNDYREK